jgi:hypothetical protein
VLTGLGIDKAAAQATITAEVAAAVDAADASDAE